MYNGDFVNKWEGINLTGMNKRSQFKKGKILFLVFFIHRNQALVLVVKRYNGPTSVYLILIYGPYWLLLKWVTICWQFITNTSHKQQQHKFTSLVPISFQINNFTAAANNQKLAFLAESIYHLPQSPQHNVMQNSNFHFI